MRSRATVYGHALHPMLVVFPLGLLSLVWVFDVVHLVTEAPLWAHVAYWLLSCGVIGGVVAAVPGLLDLMAVPRGSRAFRVGLVHLAVNASGLVLFAIDWVVRLVGGVEDAGVLALVLALVGAGGLLVGGWYGGELVERLGISVHEDASVDAQSSIAVSRRRRRAHRAVRSTRARPV